MFNPSFGAEMSQTASVMYVPLRPEFRGQHSVQHLDAPMFLPSGGAGHYTPLPERHPEDFPDFMDV